MARRHLVSGMRFGALAILLCSVAACSTTGKTSKPRSKEYFAESKYGVSASPRVATKGPMPKGGGRKMVGKPYTVKGQRFVPKQQDNYDKVGYASWYGSAFHGRLTANGEVYDQNALTAAHPTLPLPSYVRVTNMSNGNSLMVRVNDRGPFERGRIIDLSRKAADMLGSKDHGVAKVRVQYVGPARMDGRDHQYLMASYNRKGNDVPGLAPNVMLASAPPQPTVVATAGSAADNIYVTANALAASSAQFEAFDAFGTYPVLPEIGPIPVERPVTMRVASVDHTLVSGYASEPTSNFESRFDTILVDNGDLTPDAIRDYYARRVSQER